METPKTVLIVDDEKSIQYALSKLLEGWGYGCVAVSSGQEALETVTRLDFDLMLLDVRMPGMSGLDFLKRFRIDNSRTSVVMLTAVLDKKLTAEAMKYGADDFIVKPCSPDNLNKRLQRAYDRRQSARKGVSRPGQKHLEYSEVVKGQNVLNEGNPLSNNPDLFRIKEHTHTPPKEEIEEIRKHEKYKRNPWTQRGWDVPG